MTALVEFVPVRAPRVRDIALAAVAATTTGAAGDNSLERQVLDEATAALQRAGRSVSHGLDEACKRRVPEDAPLLALAMELRLSKLELLAVALAAAVEDDPVVGRVLAFVQSPVGGSRPTLGLLTRAFGSRADSNPAVLATLLNGIAIRSGLLTVLNDGAPLPERAVAVPAALCLALAGHESEWLGVTVGIDDAQSVPLPERVHTESARHAAALTSATRRALVVRARSMSEGRAVAAAIASALDRRPAFIDTDKVAGLGPWLTMRGLVPVFCHELAPGERKQLPAPPGYSGPLLALCGVDGFVETAHGAAATWTLPLPSRAERGTLWKAALNGEIETTLADRLAVDHRHGAGRIAHLGRLARHHASLAGRDALRLEDVHEAAWTGESNGLDALAIPLRTQVPDAALVVPPTVASVLETLLLRCRLREDLADGLGASASTRYQPGVRALFTGLSGTGKTLAAGWVATRLGRPIYRVDLASVTSKYIGETEKHLSQLLARAEQADIVLLFDEADSLFGRRTEITDSNDRFANAQTNYLLQRIETYEGIVLLTSNSQGRFDEAFMRRLDFVIEFPAPGLDERRALWLSHLGSQPEIPPAFLNQLSLLIDLTGGQIRNAVLAAATRAKSADRGLSKADLLSGIEVELRKAGRQVPLELTRGA